MEKPDKIPQIYGYTICLIAVITLLISLSEIITAFIDKQDPLHANLYQMNENLASFEIYKMNVLKQTKTEGETTTGSYIPNNDEIKAMYDAAINQRISTANHQYNRTFIVNGFLVLLSLVLFCTHWIWMKKLIKKS